MEVQEAEKVIESLRMGIPPANAVKHFTVGRDAEIEKLSKLLLHKDTSAVLLQANYGSGKTHLLRLLREISLENNFAVSMVTLDSKSDVRFNRLDQVFGAICRNIEVPGAPSDRGIRTLFGLAKQIIEKHKGTRDKVLFWRQVTHDWRWDYSNKLEAPAMFIALRAWSTGNPKVRALVEDWLSQSWDYKGQKKKLYKALIADLRIYFRDPRPDYQLNNDGTFSFDAQGHSQSWAAVNDLNAIAQGSGLKGLVVLFDEFEDVITNLTNIQYQEVAFWNLFQFYSGKRFAGKTFYGVTPEFTHKCKQRLISKGRWDYDHSHFEVIPTFQMSPLEAGHLEALAHKIIEAHASAYSWQAQKALPSRALAGLLSQLTAIPIQDRTRYAIKSLVQHLDAYLDETSG